MKPEEKQRIQEAIRRKNEFIRTSHTDNPYVIRWKKEIEVLEARLKGQIKSAVSK